MFFHMITNLLQSKEELVKISKIIYEETPFLPRLSVFYNYHHILKLHQFIRDFKIINRNCEFFLQVER